jgi:hypothetical protein
VDLGCLDWAADVLSVGVNGNIYPPLQVATELRSEADSAFQLVAKYGVQLAEEEFCSRDSEKHLLSLTRERLHFPYRRPSTCSRRTLQELLGLLGELLKFCRKCEEITDCRVDVDALVVSHLCWLPKTLGIVAKQSETGEEAVDSLT